MSEEARAALAEIVARLCELERQAEEAGLPMVALLLPSWRRHGGRCERTSAPDSTRIIGTMLAIAAVGAGMAALG